MTEAYNVYSTFRVDLAFVATNPPRKPQLSYLPPITRANARLVAAARSAIRHREQATASDGGDPARVEDWSGEGSPRAMSTTRRSRRQSPAADESHLSRFVTPALLSPEVVYVPYSHVHAYLPGGMPESLRAFSDDIAARPCFVGYINSNCGAMWRERLFVRLLKLLGPEVVIPRGRCPNGYTPPQGRRSYPRSTPVPHIVSDCRLVIVAENTVNVAGYITEKLLNGFLSGAVPIYW